MLVLLKSVVSFAALPRPHPLSALRPAADTANAPSCRRIRSLAYRQEAWLEVHYAEYKARCGCCKYFRSWPPRCSTQGKSRL